MTSYAVWSGPVHDVSGLDKKDAVVSAFLPPQPRHRIQTSHGGKGTKHAQRNVLIQSPKKQMDYPHVFCVVVVAQRRHQLQTVQTAACVPLMDDAKRHLEACDTHPKMRLSALAGPKTSARDNARRTPDPTNTTGQWISFPFVGPKYTSHNRHNRVRAVG